MREKFEEVLKYHGLYGEDPEDIFNAVHDMLIVLAHEIKEKEPYAVNTIHKLEVTAVEVFDACSYL